MLTDEPQDDGDSMDVTPEMALQRALRECASGDVARAVIVLEKDGGEMLVSVSGCDCVVDILAVLEQAQENVTAQGLAAAEDGEGDDYDDLPDLPGDEWRNA